MPLYHLGNLKNKTHFSSYIYRTDKLFDKNIDLYISYKYKFEG